MFSINGQVVSLVITQFCYCKSSPSLFIHEPVWPCSGETGSSQIWPVGCSFPTSASSVSLYSLDLGISTMSLSSWDMSVKWVSLGSNSRLDPKSHSTAFTVTKHYLVLVTMVLRISFTIRTGKPKVCDDFVHTGGLILLSYPAHPWDKALPVTWRANSQ